MLTAVVALTLLALPPPAAEEGIERGRTLIARIQEERAIEVLAPFCNDTSLSADLRGRALIYTGIAYLNLAREAEGRAAFRRALEVDPGASVPAWASRRVEAELDAARAQQQLARPLPAPRAPLRAPPPPMTTTHTPAVPARAPSSWVVPLSVGAGSLLALSAAGFITWGVDYNQGKEEPSAARSTAVSRRGSPYWYGALGAGAGAVALGITALVIHFGGPARSPAPAGR